jgi:hypothetical protein
MLATIACYLHSNRTYLRRSLVHLSVGENLVRMGRNDYDRNEINKLLYENI